MTWHNIGPYLRILGTSGTVTKTRLEELLFTAIMATLQTEYTDEQKKLATYTMIVPYELQMLSCMKRFERQSKGKQEHVRKLMLRAQKLSGRVILDYPSVEEASAICRKTRGSKDLLDSSRMNIGSEAMGRMSLEERVQPGSTPRESSDSGIRHSNVEQKDCNNLIDSILNRCNLESQTAAPSYTKEYDGRAQRSAAKVYADIDSRMNSSRGMTSFKLQSPYTAQGKDHFT